MIERFKSNGLDFLRIQNAKCQALMTTHGAHVLSFIPAGANDLLWVSSQSEFAPGRPIRGGIPICWPYFGAPDDPQLPQHGMARLLDWEETAAVEYDDGAVRIQMKLDSAKLPERFRMLTLEAEFEFSSTLRITLKMSNRGSSPEKISCALHSYFAVNDVRDVRISGLDRKEYYSKAEDCMGRQYGDVTFEQEVDRIYLDTEDDCLIHDGDAKRNIRIVKQGSMTTVVWNPWIAKAKAMADFGDGEYLQMVCVETVNTRDDSRILAPGENHELTAVISPE